MIYLHLALDRAIAETEARAVALEARGYRRCSYEVHRALWVDEVVPRAAALRAEVALPEAAPPDDGPAQALPVGMMRYIIKH